MLSHQGPTVWEKVSQLPAEEKSCLKMIYTLLGCFGMNPIMEGRKTRASQDFYRIDGDYPKDRCS